MSAVVTDNHCPGDPDKSRESLPHQRDGGAGSHGMLRFEKADHQVGAPELFEPF
jgi:hypothetical protein